MMDSKDSDQIQQLAGEVRSGSPPIHFNGSSVGTTWGRSAGFGLNAAERPNNKEKKQTFILKNKDNLGVMLR